MRKLTLKTKKKVRCLLAGGGRPSDETGVDSGGGRADLSSPLLRVDNRPDDPGSMPASEGESDREGRKADTSGRGITQNDPRLLSDVEGSAPSREGKDADKEEVDNQFSLVIPPIRKPDGK